MYGRHGITNQDPPRPLSPGVFIFPSSISQNPYICNMFNPLTKRKMEKPKSSAELRDFIKSHEMRYFADLNDLGQVRIRKAFKVKLEKTAYWIWFNYGCTPSLVSKRKKLVETIEEAREEAQKLRNIQLQERKKYGDKMKEVANFLDHYYWNKEYQSDDYDFSLNPEEKSLASSVKRLFYSLPGQEKDDKNTYIKLLENYIKYGTIYTQGKSFRKEHVVCVKYGDGGHAVQIELTNGTKIVPKSNSVTKLIKTIFGERLDYVYYKDIKSPTGDWDTEIEKKI